MSDEAEKTCPLCAEEMDLTDQQLKPCKCGYEICVWCWHHIMDMAEKDEAEGKCPACRTAYDKEKIVGMAANCERLVAEISSERKLKSHKAKPKTSEGRKHLSSVRVIQRNLVYIIGIPYNLADEDLLQRKEYFGQYGKVLKVSISRTAGGVIQHSANNTCSVYITYSKEEEAVRCIQSVHGFVLEGRPLRACFGTTKYCHAWLRNVPCTNPDCLYLHDIGTQEDSFTKDEIISAYTRSRVQQITGATYNLQRRSGNVLPPPADDYCNSSAATSGKPIIKSAPSNPVSQVKGSPPNGCSGRSIALPAAASWGMRASNCRSPAPSLVSSNGPVKQEKELDAFNDSLVLPSVVTNTTQSSTLHNDLGKKSMVTEESHSKHPIGRSGSLDSSKQYVLTDSCRPVSDTPADCLETASSIYSNHLSPSAFKDKDRVVTVPNSVDIDRHSCNSTPAKDGNISRSANIQSLCLRLSSMNVESQPGFELPDSLRSNGSFSNHVEFRSSGSHQPGFELPDSIRSNSSVSNHVDFRSSGSQGSQPHSDQYREPLGLQPSRKVSALFDGQSGSVEQPDWGSNSPAQVLQDVGSKVEDLKTFDSQRLKVSEEINCSYLPSHTSPNITNHDSRTSWQRSETFRNSNPDYVDTISETISSSYPSSLYNTPKVTNHYSRTWQQSETCRSSNPDNANTKTVNTKVDDSFFPYKSGDSVSLNGYNVNEIGGPSEVNATYEYSDVLSSVEKGKFLGRNNNGVVGVEKNVALDMGESSIISNILSMDFDSSDDSLTSHNFAKLLNETDKQHGSHKISSSWKAQNSNQSRFSFARHDGFAYEGAGLEPSFNTIGYMTKKYSVPQDSFENRDHFFDKLHSVPQDSFENRDQYFDKNRSGFSPGIFEESDSYFSNHSPVSSNKLSVPRAQISVPPGFTVPSRAPPPGFSSQERMDQYFEVPTGNHLLESSSLRNQYQAPPTGNISSIGDVEFIDPAILAVGKGRLPNGINNSGLDIRSGFAPQLTPGNDARLQLLMQQSISAHQNLRFAEHIGDRYSFNDPYSIPSRLLEQSQASNLTPFAQLSLQQSRNAHFQNGHWDGWNEVQAGNDLGMAEILRNERLGYNKFIPGYEDLKYRMPSGDLYNRAFGM
ncbi:uncharacterized protein LOC122057592 isoform X2 [Macadamia integrifolia]|uniref:uncharacterized protein LOC122057592 isoform X2 n=1 Tax=Macadamia integrifolia TaxID=60698 RepID=UPI001C53414F|nr:uncharacterized protein LOC122057592 isoform X2 [Macadamia integrifolia]